MFYLNDSKVKDKMKKKKLDMNKAKGEKYKKKSRNRYQRSWLKLENFNVESQKFQR